MGFGEPKMPTSEELAKQQPEEMEEDKNDSSEEEITDPEKIVENLDLALTKIEDEFLGLQEETEKMSTDEEGYDIVMRLQDLYDKTMDLSDKVGYRPMGGKSKFATPEALANEKKISSLRDRIHNFLMDETWKKRDQLKLQRK